MPAEPLLCARGLSVRYPGGAGLEDVDLELRPGETLALVGASGSGKSTLALALLGMIDPPARHAAGTVELDGRDLLSLPRAELDRLRGRELALVFQEPLTALDPVLSIGAQVAEGLRLHRGLDRAAARAAAVRALGEVGLPDPERAARSFPHQLSGGMRQRALLAIALAPGPRVLVADEPVTALDPTVRQAVLELLDRERRERGLALVLVSHDLGLVARVADRVAVLAEGRVVERGTPAELLRDPRHAATRALVAAAAALGPPEPAGREGPPEPAGPEGPPETVETAAWGSASRQLELVRGRPAPRVQLFDLQVTHAPRRGLFRRGRAVPAVRGVSLDIAAGEVLGLVGESGCGKSTLGRAVAGLLPLAGGRLVLHGPSGPLEPARLSGRALADARRRVGIVFQDPQQSLNPRHRVSRIVGEALWVHRLVPAAQVPARVGALLERVGLGATAQERYPHAFSGGERQRIALARALAVEPDVLVLDEATASLDAALRAEVLELVAGLARELELAVLLISHDLRAVRAVAGRVAVMYLGRVVELGSARDVLEHGVHPYTRALVAAERGEGGGRLLLPGEVPSPLDPPAGCSFHPRCPLAEPRCREEDPAEVERGGHRAACHLVEPD